MTVNKQNIRAKITASQFCCGMILCLTVAICLTGCSASSDNLKNGKKSAREGDWDKSVEFLEKALQDSPNDAEIKLMSAKAKWEASMEHLQKGRTLLDNKLYNAAIKEFQTSIAYFPANQKAGAYIKKARTLKEAAHYVKQGENYMKLEKFHQARESFQRAIKLNPEHPDAIEALAYFEKKEIESPRFMLELKSSTPISLKFKKTPIINVFEILTKIAGINFIFDQDLKESKVTLFMTDVSFDRFLDVLLKTNKLMGKVVDKNTMIIYPNTPAKVKEYQDLKIRTFYMTDMKAKKMVGILSKMLKTKDIIANEKLNTVVIRGSPEAVEIAAKIIEANDRAPAEVMLNVEILEVSRTELMNLGVEISDQIRFGMGEGSSRGAVEDRTKTTTASGSYSSTQSTNTKNSGSITSTEQRTTTNQITEGELGDPTSDITSTTSAEGSYATENNRSTESAGGNSNEFTSVAKETVVDGVTSFGKEVASTISGFDLTKLTTKELLITLPTVTLNLVKRDGNTKTLASPQIRVKNGEKSLIYIGERVPLIVNRKVDANNNVFYDYQYQEVGVKLEANPIINMHDEITLILNLEVSVLGDNVAEAGQPPQYKVRSRNARTTLSMRDGEMVILGGLIRDEERNLTRRIPLLGDIPAIGELFSNKNTDSTKTDILMVITPYVIKSQDIPDKDIRQIWSGREKDFSLKKPYREKSSHKYRDHPGEDFFISSEKTETSAKIEPKQEKTSAPDKAVFKTKASLKKKTRRKRSFKIVKAVSEETGKKDANKPAPPDSSMNQTEESHLGLLGDVDLSASTASGTEHHKPQTLTLWTPETPYSIQVNSYINEKEALKRVQSLKRMNYDCFMLPTDISKKRRYRIFVGQFKNYSAAHNSYKLLKKKKHFRKDIHIVNRKQWFKDE
ncbi:tetratricopeptide repeat protein [Desulfococcaceae bacterium HSG9]|nr:tetratricopeptide repeat protein [Desulfococcaceae bacterium HSG9]